LHRARGGRLEGRALADALKNARGMPSSRISTPQSFRLPRHA
jgi:hypothetical protein